MLLQCVVECHSKQFIKASKPSSCLQCVDVDGAADRLKLRLLPRKLSRSCGSKQRRRFAGTRRLQVQVPKTEAHQEKTAEQLAVEGHRGHPQGRPDPPAHPPQAQAGVKAGGLRWTLPMDDCLYLQGWKAAGRAMGRGAAGVAEAKWVPAGLQMQNSCLIR